MSTIVSFAGALIDGPSPGEAKVQVDSKYIALIEWIPDASRNIMTDDLEDCSFGLVTIVTGEIATRYRINERSEFDRLCRVQEESRQEA